MKKVFLESNGYNMIGFIFEDGMVVFDCETLEDAKTMDISNVEGCKSAAECVCNCNVDEDDIVQFDENEWEKVVEF